MMALITCSMGVIPVPPEDILLKDQLEELEKEDDGFRVYYVLNNPPEGWTGGVGFVTPDHGRRATEENLNIGSGGGQTLL
jgi:NAD(P)H-flavin reductase